MHFQSFVLITLILNYFSSIFCHQGLNRVHLKLATFHTPPFDVWTRNPDGNYTISGSSFTMMTWLGEKLNFTFSVLPVVEETSEQWAKIGPIESTFYKIINREADGSLSGYVITPDRKARMDFTHMLYSEPYTLIVPKPELESRLFAFIRPFQPLVWLYLAAALLIVVGLMSWFSWIYKKQEMKTSIEEDNENHDTNLTAERYHKSMATTKKMAKIDLSFYAVYVVNILTNHGIYTPYIQYSFRILAGCWLLAALVLVNSYSSIVVSSLTVPKMKPSVNSFEDLASSNQEVSLVLRKDLVVGHLILGATTGVFKILGDQLRQHPDRLFLDIPSVFKKLEIGRYAFPFVRSFNQLFIVNQFKKDGKCRFQLSDPLSSISSGYYCLLLQKDSKYTPMFNFGLVHLWETGLVYFWIRNEIPRVEQCFAKQEKAKSSIRQVGIKLEGVWLKGGLGLGLRGTYSVDFRQWTWALRSTE